MLTLISDVTKYVLKKNTNSLYHLCANGCITWYGLIFWLKAFTEELFS